MRIVVALPTRGLSGGARKHLECIIPLLRQDPRTEDLRLFLAMEQLPRFQAIAPALPVGRFRVEHYIGYPGLGRAMGRIAPDVVFVPTARAVRTAGAPLVVMVRNMEPLIRPRGGNSLQDSLLNMMRTRAARRACRRATRVIAVSEYVRDVLIERWGLDPSKIAVVPHGVEAEAPGAERLPAALADRKPGRFAFTAGSIRPARGLEDLIPAFAAARREGMLDSLVIAGEASGAGAVYERAVKDLIRAHDIEAHVVWAGNLDSRQMAWCYRASEVFVMTSRVEACPNIVLEALAYGCLAVSTIQDPMPEFFRDAAVYYRGGDSEDLGRQLQEVLVAGPAYRERLRKRALSRARDFGWDTCAERTLEQLDLAARSR